MILQALAFYVFAFVVMASAAMVVVSRNPVYSVLFLILAFFNAAALFVLIGAEFIAMILIIVYVGAVAVLFLFVVMMLDINFAELRQGFVRYAGIGAVIDCETVGAIVHPTTTSKSSARKITPTRAPIGKYCRKPCRSSAKSTSSIMTTNRNSTATAPT